MGLNINAVTVYKKGIFGGIAKAIAGWTGLENCGNLLEYKIDVGYNNSVSYGYRDPADPVSPFGTIDNNVVAETIIYAAEVASNTNVCILRFGVNGFSKIQDRDTVTVTWQGYPALIYLWNGTNLNYEITDAGLTNWLVALNGQRVSIDVEYIAIMAKADGTTAFQRAIAAGGGVNEVTVSMWVWRNSGINTSQKMYDTGDGVTGGNDTTRFRHSTTGGLKSILSNADTGTYVEVSSVTAAADSTEDTLHHLWMTAKNDIVDGVGTQIMYLYEDNILLGTDTTFFPTNNTKFSSVPGDFVTLLARHNLAQFLTGRVADIWSGHKYIDPAIGIPLFRKTSPADAQWGGGIPVDLGATGVVLGITPTNYLGGSPSYTLADWNNGVNRGAAGDFIRSGNPLT